ncbi:IS66 family insertion sequence element accessory protein TnpB [Methylobacter sp.]|uniref:IS66 family insertion sequence element accessory protein TnpB n=1 Tax=Methylobacter sp. TaxID=2051955 RepID=UPI003DA52A72
MLFSFNAPIWFYPQPVDFRKQLDGLVMVIADHLQMNPASGQLFIFRNRSRSKLKMIWWDSHGFWLFYRRLEKGFFQLPPADEHVLELTRDQFSWLLSGLNCLQQISLPVVKAAHFC